MFCALVAKTQYLYWEDLFYALIAEIQYLYQDLQLRFGARFG